MLSRRDVPFAAYGPQIISVRGPSGAVAFVRNGDFVTSADPTAVTAWPEQQQLAVLEPSAPNPFRPGTALHFRLREPAPVRLRILDVRGREVRVLQNGRLAAGRFALRWDGTDERGRAQAAGVYLVELQAGTERLARKVVLAR